jgi:hypothetical protein
MSSVIYEKKINDLKSFVIRRFARGKDHKDKCGYSILVGTEVINLDAYEMRELVDTLKVFFGGKGYP